MTQFITLAGRKQVGKDTSANLIKNILLKRWRSESWTEEEVLPRRVHVVHFADALKEACVLIFGISRQDMETEEGKKKLTDVVWPMQQLRQKIPGVHDYEVVGYSPHHPQAGKPTFMTVREILQFVGTDLFRNQMDPDIWVKSIFRRKYGEEDVVIIADARFPNEASFAKEHGLLIKVERDTGVAASDLHISERALDDYQFDLVVDNNSDLIVLKEKLYNILRDRQVI